MIVALLAVAAITVTTSSCDSVHVADESRMADAPLTVSGAGDVIPGQYIVILHPRVTDSRQLAGSLTRGQEASVLFAYEHALKGFAFSGSEAAARALEANPNVERVIPDRVITHAGGGTQSNATWGLDRVDQRALPLDGLYTYETTASNVHAYIIDSGIRYNHSDFGGRVSTSIFFDAFGGDGSDGNGHGTHVAGTVGGSTWGVAKGVQLYSVRVLDNRGSGSLAGVMGGVDWVTGRKVANPTHAIVANMSLSGGVMPDLDNAVRNSINAGVTYVVAASNDGADACNYSPARVAEAVTIGATNSSDTRPSWSNFGPCVDLFAPGVSITSAWHIGPTTRTNTISGTSMAAPHVAGAAALYLASNPGASPAQVFSAIFDNATKGVVNGANSANNHLLYTLFGEGGGDPPPPPPSGPSASFTYSCTALSCDFTDTSVAGDNPISNWAWTFGDGNSSSDSDPSHTYGSGGTRTVTLTVTDSAGETDSASQSVTVSASGGGEAINLTGTASKVRGRWRSDLSWSPAGTSAQVDVYRQGSVIATSSNSGSYVDQTNFNGGGSLTYKVCEAGTSTCSNELTLDF